MSVKSKSITPEIRGELRTYTGELTFDDTIENLSNECEVTVHGLPSAVELSSPKHKYTLIPYAWINKNGGITVDLIWDDGTIIPYVKPLPEDEIGAYSIDAFGNKTYLLFHTYDICMYYLGSDELCSGYERCFHKELPYIYTNDRNKEITQIGYPWAIPEGSR